MSNFFSLSFYVSELIDNPNHHQNQLEDLNMMKCPPCPPCHFTYNPYLLTGKRPYKKIVHLTPDDYNNDEPVDNVKQCSEDVSTD